MKDTENLAVLVNCQYLRTLLHDYQIAEAHACLDQISYIHWHLLNLCGVELL